MTKNLTSSQHDLRGVISRLGALPPDRQDRVIDTAEARDEGEGLTAQQWHQVIDDTQ
jgi:hypothetical protein